MTAYVGGWLMSDAGVASTTPLADGEAVPSTAVFFSGLAHAQDGSVYITTWPAAGDVHYKGKFAVRSDGALITLSGGTIAEYERGIALTARGEVVTTTDAPTVSRGGFGVTATGALSVSSEAGAADTTAPTLSSPTDAANGSTAGTLGVTTDEGNGTLYWVVTTSATAPSAAQVQAGQDHTGAAATDDGSQSVSSSGAIAGIAATGLTAETAYYAHFCHVDAATNVSDVVSGDGFTTDAAAVTSQSVLLPGAGIVVAAPSTSLLIPGAGLFAP